VYILKGNADGAYNLTHAIKAHSRSISCVVLNNIASILATVCYNEGKVKLWNVNSGLNVRVYIH